jgi:hypothetical protein
MMAVMSSSVVPDLIASDESIASLPIAAGPRRLRFVRA